MEQCAMKNECKEECAIYFSMQRRRVLREGMKAAEDNPKR
jgi:hypothetical protein